MVACNAEGQQATSIPRKRRGYIPRSKVLIIYTSSLFYLLSFVGSLCWRMTSQVILKCNRSLS